MSERGKNWISWTFGMDCRLLIDERILVIYSVSPQRGDVLSPLGLLHRGPKNDDSSKSRSPLCPYVASDLIDGPPNRALWIGSLVPDGVNPSGYANRRVTLFLNRRWRWRPTTASYQAVERRPISGSRL
jgi:hypothetical protein